MTTAAEIEQQKCFFSPLLPDMLFSGQTDRQTSPTPGHHDGNGADGQRHLRLQGPRRGQPHAGLDARPALVRRPQGGSPLPSAADVYHLKQ